MAAVLTRLSTIGNITRTVCLSFLVLGLLSLWSEAAFAARYTVTVLNDPEVEFARAHAINDVGQVVGGADQPDDYHPFRWSSSVMEDLGTFGGRTGEAHDVNALGQVAGWAKGTTQDGAFVYSGGVMTNIANPATYLASEAYGINDAGHAVGYVSRYVGGNWISRAFFYDGSALQELGTLGGQHSEAQAVDSQDRVVGHAQTAAGSYHAFIWEDGLMTDLGTVDGQKTVALDINEQGTIVGHAGDALSGHSQAIVYENGWQVLNSPAGVTDARAWAVNDEGDIVGEFGSYPSYAFIYENDGMSDLNDLIDPGSGLELFAAYDINDAGVIVGSALTTDGREHAVLLAPVAETEQDLARGFRPHLLFDEDEHWRPISVDALLAEQVEGQSAHRVCHEISGGPNYCEPVTTPQDLLDFAAAHPDSDPGSSPSGDNLLDIRGDERTGGDASDYHAPTLDGCLVPADRDCDSGPNSVMYYNRTIADALPEEPGSKSYWDYWYFFRYNHSAYSTGCQYADLAFCFEHEGDWEGVTVVTTPDPAAPEVLWVSYAGHDELPRRYTAGALRDAGRFSGDHVRVYSAAGTHAAYSSPCAPTVVPCEQDNEDLVDRFEGQHGGESPWSRNDDVACGEFDSCVLPLPETLTAPTTLPNGNASGWTGWQGRWGNPCQRLVQGVLPDPCGRRPGPRSPGNQDRYRLPWSTRSANQPATLDARRGTGASADARLADESDCDTWFGSEVAALACDRPLLRRTLSRGEFDRRGRFALETTTSGYGSAGFPGLLQLIGPPLTDGDTLTTLWPLPRTGELRLRVALAADALAAVRFRFAKLPPAQTLTLEIRGSVYRPRVRLRSDAGRTAAADSISLSLRPPDSLRTKRRGDRLDVSFVATGGKTSVWIASPAQRRVLRHIVLSTRSGDKATLTVKAMPKWVTVFSATVTPTGKHSAPRVLERR